MSKTKCFLQYISYSNWLLLQNAIQMQTVIIFILFLFSYYYMQLQ